MNIPTSQTATDQNQAPAEAESAAARETGSFTQSVAKTAHDAIDRARETAAQVEQSLVQNAGLTQEQARELGAQAQLSSKQTLDTLQTYVKTHPLESLGIAFISGVVLSRLLQR